MQIKGIAVESGEDPQSVYKGEFVLDLDLILQISCQCDPKEGSTVFCRFNCNLTTVVPDDLPGEVVLAFVIALTTVSFHTIRASCQNPGMSLRYE